MHIPSRQGSGRTVRAVAKVVAWNGEGQWMGRVFFRVPNCRAKWRRFSAGILRHLGKSPFFQAKLKKDGSPSDKDMLTVSATIIAVADSQIAKLEKRVNLFNTPMFQLASAGCVDPR